MQKGIVRVSVVVGLVFCACGGVKTPSERAAVDFMDHYYVETDLASALKNTDGFASEKVKKSLELTAGQEINASTHHPDISYRLLRSEIDGAEASYLYQVMIQPEKMDPIRKKTLLKIRERSGGQWKVTQFSDQDDE